MSYFNRLPIFSFTKKKGNIMSKIIFLEDKVTIYEVAFNQIGEHQIRLVFENIRPSDEILLSG